MGKTFFYFKDSDLVVANTALPDVYWDGKPEEGLADDPVTGKARIFSSKREKAEYLQAHNLQEAGDAVHGSRMLTTSGISAEERKVRSIEQVRMAQKKVSEMGKDVRRQEVLRIIKEAHRAGM